MQINKWTQTPVSADLNEPSTAEKFVGPHIPSVESSGQSYLQPNFPGTLLTPQVALALVLLLGGRPLLRHDS